MLKYLAEKMLSVNSSANWREYYECQILSGQARQE
jgi:hypothetical protein